MNHFKKGAVALVAMAAVGVGAAGADRYRDLYETRAVAAAAWREIGDIHAARERTAHATLDQADRPLPASDVEKARAMLSQVRALPADPALLDDPMALDTYKRYQGELTGALFGLAFGAANPADAADAAALVLLRTSLARNEAALAQARQRYRRAAEKHNAVAATLPGTLVAMLTGQGPIPPEL